LPQPRAALVVPPAAASAAARSTRMAAAAAAQSLAPELQLLSRGAPVGQRAALGSCSSAFRRRRRRRRWRRRPASLCADAHRDQDSLAAGAAGSGGAGGPVHVVRPLGAQQQRGPLRRDARRAHVRQWRLHDVDGPVPRRSARQLPVVRARKEQAACFSLLSSSLLLSLAFAFTLSSCVVLTHCLRTKRANLPNAAPLRCAKCDAFVCAFSTRACQNGGAHDQGSPIYYLEQQHRGEPTVQNLTTCGKYVLIQGALLYVY
jgi:hypothetical protein